MTIEDILAKCNHLAVSEKRVHAPDFDERVIFQKELEEWLEIFTDIFGPPVKPAGQKTTREEFSLTVNHGGINEDQILFYEKFDDCKMIIMLWPWQDKESITLKIVRIKI